MKYLGSKRRLAKYILPIIEKNRKKGDIYIEPFAGGMNLIDKVKGKRIANDINPYLIALFKALIKGYKIPEDISKEDYDYMRKNINDFSLEYVGAVGFCYSYNGKFLGGYAKDTICKTTGVLRQYNKEGIKSLYKQIENLKDVIFLNKQYYELEIPKNSIIYCDPPYKNTTGYKGDNSFNHDEFWEWCRYISKTNDIFISEYSAPKDFICLESINYSKSLVDQKSNSIEKIFTHI